MPNEYVNVRYMVDDVDAAIDFYTTHFGFTVLTNAAPAFADVARGPLRLLLSGPKSSAGRPMSDGRQPGPGGWNRIHLLVDDIGAETERLRAAGLSFRNDIVTGPGGSQVLVDDPSGNAIELFQPRGGPLPAVTDLPGERIEPAPTLATVLVEWGRIGCIGFGGPPTHIALLRELCVQRRGWLTEDEFEDGVAACNLLPGPASTQLAIYCARRVRGPVGAVVGGLGFIVPGLVLILALAALFLASSPPLWVRGAGAGAGAAVAAVAVRAGSELVPTSRRRARSSSLIRWTAYLTLGAFSAATLGPWLVLVLLSCGGIEVVARNIDAHGTPLVALPPVVLAGATAVAGGLASLTWVAFKVGALSYGGGFVIIPLMQADAVHRYHWMTNGQFLDAVALGQVTPGPVVQTVAVVGYAAGGVGGGLLAALVAFSPSFLFIVVGARHFDRFRANPRARAFLDGAGPAAIGAIFGAAVPLALGLREPWQLAVLTAAAILLLVLRRAVVTTLLAAGAVGIMLAIAGAPVPR